MFGMRLRYQIAGFLFFLFAMVVVLMGYFNLSILNDLSSRFALYRAQANAFQAYSRFEYMFPGDFNSMKKLAEDREKILELSKYTETLDSFNNFSIYNTQGEQIYAFNKFDPGQSIIKEQITQVQEKIMPLTVIWSIDPNTSKVRTVSTLSVFEGGSLFNDFLYPVIREGKMIGVFRVSFHMEIATSLIKFFFIGNATLAFIFMFTAILAIYLWSENAINRPIRSLLDAQDQLRKGDFNAQVDLDMPLSNELSIIANSFNRMTSELRQYQDELTNKAQQMEKLNEQYRTLNETLEQEVENKTLELREFFSLITHDLKIPLAAIKGYTALLRKEKTGPLNQKQERFVGSIETATVHLLNMVKNMLDSVKYDDGRVTYFMETFELTRVIEEVQDHILPIISEKNISFQWEIPPEHRMVYGDRVKIGQVVTNIVSNAINYTSQGGNIELSTRQDGDIIEVKISDTGIGIPPEQLPLIFEKFQRVPSKESPATNLGLGLYIVRKIMEGHNTRVWAESFEGEGSSFYFTLKRSTEESGVKEEKNLTNTANAEDEKKGCSQG